MRWPPLGDFLISARGRRVTAYPAVGVAAVRLRELLLTAVASFALLERGVETLHASAVDCPAGAVAFLGGPGAGKSTLAALLARKGGRVLTDDLLVVHSRAGRILAYPALPEIKLSAAAARALKLSRRRLPRVEPGYPKRLWRAPAARKARPLTVLYFPRLSASRRSQVRLTPLTARAAFQALLACSYNITRSTRKRLREQFGLFARLARSVPARRLLIPRGWGRLKEVGERIERDLANLGS